MKYLLFHLKVSTIKYSLQLLHPKLSIPAVSYYPKLSISAVIYYPKLFQL